MDKQFKKFLDLYHPVIESCIKIQAHYNGRIDGVPKVCPDVTGEMITHLIKARKQMNLVKVTDVEVEDGK